MRIPAFAAALTLLLATPAAAQTQAAIQSQYDATPNNGTIAIPAGAWPAANWWAPFAPAKTNPNKSVLWAFTTPTPPTGAIGDNDVTESFWGGHLNFMRNVFTGNPGNATVLITLDDYSRGYQTIHYNNDPIGEFPDVPALQVNATTHPHALGQVNGIEVNVNSQGNNGFAAEDQGLNIKLNKSGSNSSWAISTLSNDTTGRPPGAFATIAGEYDIYANGPDDPAALYNPLKGNRIFVWMVGKVSPVTPWSAHQHFAAGDRVLATADNIKTVYVANNAGATGAAAPSWPTSGTTEDGTITWSYGEPYAVTYGRAIALDGQAGQPVTFATGFSSNAGFENAVIDLSTARLLRPQSAGIRLAANMPLDFSADATAQGQNRHTLTYVPASNTLTYAVNNKPALSIAPGHIATAGPTPRLACGAATISPTANDRHGTITPGATTCTITFAQPYATAPDCELTAWSPTPPYIRAVTTTALTVTTTTKFTYLCEQ